MAGKTMDPKAEAQKMAALSIVWGAVAAVAYLGLVARAIDLIKAATGWVGPGEITQGIIKIHTSAHAISTSDLYGTLFAISVPAIPAAIVAVIALGIAARVKSNVALGGGLVAGAAVGLLGSLALFAAVVNTKSNLNDFLLSLATIVLVTILVRLQKQLRQAFKSNPAVASILLTVVVLAYIFLSNGTSITGIILRQVDIWLALIAFATALYAGITYIRKVRKAG